jgi:hypothetical protein
MSAPPASPDATHSSTDESPPSSPVVLRTVLEEPDGIPIGTQELEDEFDSDDDESINEEISEAETLDTEARDPASFGGAETEFTEAHCLVKLGKKIGGQVLLCGYLSDECNRPKHGVLRTKDERRGQPGLYVTTPNNKGTVMDAIEDTLITAQEREAQRQVNRVLMEQMGASTQKSLDELDQVERSQTLPRV